jgi:hypothetical protein
MIITPKIVGVHIEIKQNTVTQNYFTFPLDGQSAKRKVVRQAFPYFTARFNV